MKKIYLFILVANLTILNTYPSIDVSKYFTREGNIILSETDKENLRELWNLEDNLDADEREQSGKYKKLFQLRDAISLSLKELNQIFEKIIENADEKLKQEFNSLRNEMNSKNLPKNSNEGKKAQAIFDQMLLNSSPETKAKLKKINDNYARQIQEFRILGALTR